MTIKVSYTSASPVYINIGYGTVDGGAVWGDITGTLSNQADLQAALNAKVPYSGATGNVNLGEYELKAGQLTFDTSPTGTATVATMRWNDTTGLTETTLKGGSVVLKNGVDLVARVVNKVSPNTTLTKAAYQAVRVSGAQGQRLAVAFAQANNDNNSADTIGLVTETIATNQEGFIMTVGQLEGINTTGSLQGETWVDGDVLYLSPTTAGALTNVKPVAPQHLVIIGYVEYAHANNGKIYVKVMNGWELGELHDVNTTGATNGSVLKYNGSIWVPSSDIDTGITTLNTLTALSQSFATGTSGTDFNISSATSTHTFNLPSASATNRGLLTSADWTTFNNKQNALTNPITGTGVSGQVAYWSGTNTQVGDVGLTYDGTNKRLQFGTGATRGYITYDVSDNTIFNIDTASGRSFLVGSSTRNIQISAASNIFRAVANIFQAGNGAELGRMNSAGNFLLNSTTDFGQRLQVTGDGYFSGSVGIGTSSLTAANLTVAKTIASDGSYGIYQLGQIQTAVTGNSGGFINALVTIASTNLTNYYHYRALEGTIGATTSITNNFGYHIADMATGTNRFGFYGNVSSGTGKWNLYMNGTANNYLAGSLGIGTSTLAAKLTVVGASTVIGQTNVSARFSDDLNSTLLISHPASTGAAATITGNEQLAFATGAVGSIAERVRIFSDGNVGIGTGSSNAGYKLDVNGTMRVSGASTFGGRMTLDQSVNLPVYIEIKNTTSGNNAGAYLVATSTNGVIEVGKYSATNSTYKILSANTGFIRNSTAGDLSILNDWASGEIKMAAGGSSTAHFTIASTGAATFSSSVTAASYTINDAGNITIGTTTGTKIGTATSQKIGFWNATPIVQPTTAVAAAAFVANTGTAVNDASTFDGYTMAQIVKALRNAGLLA